MTDFHTHPGLVREMIERHPELQRAARDKSGAGRRAWEPGPLVPGQELDSWCAQPYPERPFGAWWRKTAFSGFW